MLWYGIVLVWYVLVWMRYGMLHCMIHCTAHVYGMLRLWYVLVWLKYDIFLYGTLYRKCILYGTVLGWLKYDIPWTTDWR